MFDILDDQIKRDEAQQTSTTGRLVRWAAALVVTTLVLGALYFGVQLAE